MQESCLPSRRWGTGRDGVFVRGESVRMGTTERPRQHDREGTNFSKDDGMWAGDVGAGDQTPILYRSGKYSQLSSQLLSPLYVLFLHH